MRYLIVALIAFIHTLSVQAQVTLSLDAQRALPGERIGISCGLQISDDYKPNRVTATPYLLTPTGEKFARGGVRGVDVYKSKGGLLSYSRAELLAGDCGLAFAPLVPGVYEYEVVVQFYRQPEERPFTLSLIVDPLPFSEDILQFTRMYLKPHYGYRMAGFSLKVPPDRCYPRSLNPELSELVIFDASTGWVRSSIAPGGHMNYAGSKTKAIDQYNCVPAGTIVDGLVAPDLDAPGDWHLALVIRKKNAPLCIGRCGDDGLLAVENLHVVAVAPIENLPAEPSEDSELYFERVTKNGLRRAAEASLGEQVRVVLDNPKATTERTVAVTAGRKSHMIELKPDGHRLVSDFFTLGAPADD